MTAVNWTHRVGEIGERPLEVERKALPSELPAVANELDVPSCEALSARYTIRPLGRGRYMLTGKAEATVTQSCVITLEPITSSVSDAFEIEFWPPDDLPGAVSADAIEAFGPDEPEAIVNGVIDVGVIILDSLSGAIDRYPRKPGAVFSWVDKKADADSDNPFAKLKGFGRQS